jgi:hypothetical protein
MSFSFHCFYAMLKAGGNVGKFLTIYIHIYISYFRQPVPQQDELGLYLLDVSRIKLNWPLTAIFHKQCPNQIWSFSP